MATLTQLAKEIDSIKERNRRVEADKAWETSGVRTTFIAVSTFLLLYIFFRLIDSEAPFLNSLISTIAYLLSTFSYGQLKSWWLKRRKD